MIELDTQIYQLDKSNRIMQDELKGDTDLPYYLKENNEIMAKAKQNLLLFLSKFLKIGINLEKEVFPFLRYRDIYMPKDDDEQKDQEESKN